MSPVRTNFSWNLINATTNTTGLTSTVWNNISNARYSIFKPLSESPAFFLDKCIYCIIHNRYEQCFSTCHYNIDKLLAKLGFQTPTLRLKLTDFLHASTGALNLLVVSRTIERIVFYFSRIINAPRTMDI